VDELKYQLKEILKEHYHVLSFDKDQTIINQGDEAQGLYFIESGVASVYIRYPGKNTIKVNELSVNDFFGEISLIAGGLCTATIRVKKSIQCYYLSRRDFKLLITCHPQKAHKVISLVTYYNSQRLINILDDLSNQSLKDIEIYKSTTNAYAQYNQISCLNEEDNFEILTERFWNHFNYNKKFTCKELQLLTSGFQIVNLKRNSLLFSPENPFPYIALIINGAVQLTFQNESLEFKLDSLGPGSFIGMTAYINNLQQPFNCIVREYVQLALLPFEKLNQIRDNDPNLYNKLFFQLASSEVNLSRSVNKHVLRVKSEMNLLPSNCLKNKE